MQNLFLAITPLMFYTLVWLIVMQSVFYYLLYRKFNRLMKLAEKTRWCYDAMLSAAKNAYCLTAYTATRRWEVFLKDVETITKTMQDETQDKKPTS